MAATKKKSPAQRSSRGKGKKKLTKKERQARNQLWAVVLFAVGIFLLCLAVVPGEGLWLLLHKFLRGCFSWCAFLIGPVVIYAAIMTAVDQTNYPVAAKVISSSVLILLFSGASQIFSQNIPTGNFFHLVVGLYDNGIQLQGGGVFSLAAGIPLLKLMDFTGAAITVVLLIFVFLMILSGGTLAGLFHSAITPVRKLEEAYTSAVESRAVREQNKPQSNPGDWSINVPIDGEPLPRHGLRAPKTAEFPPAPPDPDLSRSKEKLLDATAGLSRKDAYNFNNDHPQPAPEPQVPSPDDLVFQAVSGDTTLGQAPQTSGGKLDFAPLPEATQTPPAEPAPAPDVPPPTPLAPPIEPVHTDNTVAPTQGDSSENLRPHYSFPPLNLLDEPQAPSQVDTSRELKTNADLLENTLRSFGVQARIINASRGPAVTRYELQPAAGVKISRVTGLADDIALNLSAAGVRIEAPIPNKPAIGIEVPNKIISTVSIREIIDSPVFQNAGSPLTVALGKDITGNAAVADIGKMPHVLIAGATGSGKSVCINSIIISLLYKSSPERVKLLMIDPKVVELGVYNGIPHLLVPVVTDPKKAAGALCWAVGEMLKRYKIFADTGARDLKGYNRMAEENGELPPLPQIVIIIDELADLMMASPKDVEDYICRLAQMARAAGMHLVIATQRPSVDVITGLIKANIPSRISFAVSSAIDSRTILDGGGAEKLLGRGDMLFSPVGSPKPMRVQGCFVTDQEVERVVAFVKEGEKPDYDETVISEIERQAANSNNGKGNGGSSSSDSGDDDDALLDDAICVVVEAGLASTSLLQRRLKVGYARAARLVDEMEQRGIVGPFEGSKPRQVLLSKDRYYEMKLNKEP